MPQILRTSATEWLRASCHIVSFDLWSVKRKTTAQSPHKGNPAGVFGGVHLKPCWLDALSTPTGLSVSRVQQRARPTRAPVQEPQELQAGTGFFTDWTDLPDSRQKDCYFILAASKFYMPVDI